MQAHGLAAGSPAIGDQVSVDVNDTHIRWTIRNGPIRRRRHLGCEIDQHACKGDTAPEAKYEAPVDRAAQKAEKATRLLLATS